MGFFDPPRRPRNIKILNVENHSSNATVSYSATYSDGSKKNLRKSVHDMYSYYHYDNNYPGATDPTIKAAECLGRVYVGFLKSRVKILFLVWLSDGTMDIIAENEGSSGCNRLLDTALSGADIADGESDSEAEKAYDASIGKRKASKDGSFEEDIDIPIEVLNNLYSISLSNVSIKHHQTYDEGELQFDYLVLRCRVNFRLNGRKEGKRYVIFTSYDDKDGVIEIKGELNKLHFTEAGFEFVEICFDDYDKNPVKKIAVSVKEP